MPSASSPPPSPTPRSSVHEGALVRRQTSICRGDQGPTASLGDHRRDAPDVHHRTTVNMSAVTPPPLQGVAAHHPTIEVLAEWLEIEETCASGADAARPPSPRAWAITPWRSLPPPPASMTRARGRPGVTLRREEDD
jgi:hypothetical protein